MSEARTPEEETIKPHDAELQDEEYDGPDPESDDRGDGL
jgi:hypothetical protein